MFFGLSWWSSGWDSVLPLQGVMGSIPGRGIKIPYATDTATKTQGKNKQDLWPAELLGNKPV